MLKTFDLFDFGGIILHTDRSIERKVMATKNASAPLIREPNPSKKYFTVAEANRALSYVMKVVDDITARYGEVVQLSRQIELPRFEDKINDLEVDYGDAMDRLNALVDELQHVGVELKDFEKGLVDFPAIHEGREVCLCWCRGESQIEAWHEIDAGFVGRQDLAPLGDV